METRQNGKSVERCAVEKKKRFAIVKLEERIAPSHAHGAGGGSTGGTALYSLTHNRTAPTQSAH